MKPFVIWNVKVIVCSARGEIVAMLFAIEKDFLRPYAIASVKNMKDIEVALLPFGNEHV